MTQLTASDPDLPPNAEPFKFKLLTGTPLFSLDEESGILLTKTSIDREQFDKFDLTIEVQDAGGLSSRSNLFIEVGDENDNPSKSRQVQVIIKNFEGTFPGNHFYFFPQTIHFLLQIPCSLVLKLRILNFHKCFNQSNCF